MSADGPADLPSDVEIDIGRLMESRLIVTGNSGAGKSRALRRIIEQLYGQVQLIVLDPEEEFYTLREKFDFVLAGAEGDCPAEVRTAGMLARKLVELNVSAVLGIGEMELEERLEFVATFFRELMETPRDLRKRRVVILDEADLYDPEGAAKSGGGRGSDSPQSVCARAVTDLCVRGRKRSLCAILATQRPAMLAKAASSQCINKLMGRQSQDVDVERIGKDLGLSKSNKEVLRALHPGEFFATGPAFGLNAEVVVVAIGDIQTTHPALGEYVPSPPPPRGQVATALAQLKNLPDDQQPGDKTAVVDAGAVRDQAGQIERLQKAKRDAENSAAIARQWFERCLPHLHAFVEQLRQLTKTLEDDLRAVDVKFLAGTIQMPDVGKEAEPVELKSFTWSKSEGRPSNGSACFKRPVGIDRAVLSLLRQWPNGLTKAQISVLADLGMSGHLSKAYAAMHKSGAVRTSAGRLLITQIGEAQSCELGSVEYPTGADFFAFLLDSPRMNVMSRKMMTVLFDEATSATGGGGSGALSKKEILRRAGLQSSGHASKEFARLRRKLWVEPADGGLRLSKEVAMAFRGKR